MKSEIRNVRFKDFIFHISCFAFLFSLISCETDIEKVRMYISPTNTPVETAKDVELLYSDSAKMKVKMTAPEMNSYDAQKKYVEMPKGITLLFYDDSMHVSSQLTANYAIRYEPSGMMEAKNNVIVINSKGEKLSTEDLIWDEENQELYTKAHVRIETENETLEGEGLKSNRDFTEYKITKPSGTTDVADSTLDK